MIFSAYPIRNHVFRRKYKLFHFFQLFVFYKLMSGMCRQSVSEEHCQVGNKVNLILLGGVPMANSGGGQRSAQLAIWAKRRSYNVHHFHVLSQILPSRLRGHIQTNLGISDLPLRSTNPSVFLQGLKGDIIMLVELPHKRTITWLDAALHLRRAKIIVERLFRQDDGLPERVDDPAG